MGFDIGSAWDSFTSSVSDGYDAVADSAVGQTVGEVANDIGTGLGNAATDVGNGWSEAVDDISTGYEQGDLLGGLGNAAGSFGNGLAQGVGDTYTGLSDGVGDGWNSLNSGVHDLGNTLQQGYTDGVNAFGSVIGDVAGQDVAHAFTSGAMALEAPVRQAAQFGWGVAEGAVEGTGGLVDGVADLAGGAYQYATDSSYRDGVNNAVGNFAQSAWNDPLGTARDIGNGALNIGEHIWEGGVQAYQNGNLSEYIGHGVGYAVPVVAAAVLAPEAEVGEVAALSSEATVLTGEAAVLTTEGAALTDSGLVARIATQSPFNQAGQLERNGSRVVFNQGNAPTCAPTSCGMVLDTVGRPVDLGELIKSANVGPNGMAADRVADLLKAQGVDATFKTRVTVEELAQATAGGNPAIAAVQQGGGGHAVVVDGVTTRQGVSVVAIRDPWGQQYFETVDAFEQRFLRQAITINGATK
jgi:Peptidase C39 family